MLPLIIAPNKILRTPTKELALPLDAKILKLIPEMFAAIEYYKGIGLAAPQINASLRLMVMATTSGPKAFINPKVVKASRKLEDMEEGCLSLPGLFGVVRRPYSVAVEYISPGGKKITANLKGMTARVFQHETDHLDGVLITDKITEYTNGHELFAKYQGA